MEKNTVQAVYRDVLSIPRCEYVFRKRSPAPSTPYAHDQSAMHRSTIARRSVCTPLEHW